MSTVHEERLVAGGYQDLRISFPEMMALCRCMPHDNCVDGAIACERNQRIVLGVARLFSKAFENDDRNGCLLVVH